MTWTTEAERKVAGDHLQSSNFFDESVQVRAMMRSLRRALRAVIIDRVRGLLVFTILVFAAASNVHALGGPQLVRFTADDAGFPLVRAGKPVPLVVGAQEKIGVRRAAEDFQKDVQRVSGEQPASSTELPKSADDIIIVGTIGDGGLVDEWAQTRKLGVDEIRGHWESFIIQSIENPAPGIGRALVIAGSDKRGTIYGLYTLSEQMGVSPWYWWADVPVARHANVFVRPEKYIQGEPAVKYRGIFLNDEAPALSGWTAEKFGGFNHVFYEHVFELLLRLKANYLWPAMWGNAFNEDDPANPRLADEYGIVMGTSHHEPMLRAQQEWKRHGTGPWDYATNAEVLKKFWTEGVRRNRRFESITTIGMRGDGDLPMSEESNIALLERVVRDQRRILAENVNPDLAKVPQLWALYKEVQGYYEKGMRVPDDVTLLWCDDNWGNIRRLPTEAERTRAGGAGIYYHFDYVGGPRNYKWINVTPITKVWEQMDLAYRYGADRIWIVNVGDLKPMEFPIEFFLTLAWDPDRWPAEKLQDYTVAWATREFGPEHAAQIAELVSASAKYNARRKPELLSPETYSLINYHEAENVWADFKERVESAEHVQAQLPPEARDAFFELVLHPIKAAAIVNQLYIAVAKNRLYATQQRASTNDWARLARDLFAQDAELGHVYNTELKGGKWNHMMDQTHIGYTGWQQPATNVMPEVKTYSAPDTAELGVAVEGDSKAWHDHDHTTAPAMLAPVDSVGRQVRWIDVFRSGTKPVSYRVIAQQPWLKVSPTPPDLREDQRIEVSVDWATAPRGKSQGTLAVHTSQGDLTILLPVDNDAPTRPSRFSGFVETSGLIAIEAESFQRAIAGQKISWRILPDFGRTRSGVTTTPVLYHPLEVTPASPYLEYNFWVVSGQPLTAHFLFSPSQAFQPGRGLRCAVSIDEQAPSVLDISPRNQAAWEREVMDSVQTVDWPSPALSAGAHVLKFWAVDPGVVLEKIVLDFGGLKPSYLGPPETGRVGGGARVAVGWSAERHL